jgi:hypothetical protein
MPFPERHRDAWQTCRGRSSPWHGIHTRGDGAYIRDVRPDDANDNSAIRIVVPDNEVVLEDCEIVNDTAPGTERGFEIIKGAHSTVRNTIVRGWGYGIMVAGTSDPVIEGSRITENIAGIIAHGGSGQISQPDVGGGARGWLGGNVIQGNSQIGLKNRCDTALWAQSNTWDHDPPTEGPPYPCDIENEGAGSVIWF